MSRKRERSANFTLEEVKLLLQLIRPHISILENKKTDNSTNKKKYAVWREIERSFNAVNSEKVLRSWKTLKFKFDGIKKARRRAIQQKQRPNKNEGDLSTATCFIDVEEDKALSTFPSSMREMDSRIDDSPGRYILPWHIQT